MPEGYTNRILWVDLSTGFIETRELAENVYKQFLGGIGLGARVLYDRIPADADPLGPENVLGFLPGLLTGSGLPFSGRWMAVGRSPLTEGWGDANSGGYFGPELRRAGLDGVFVTGVAMEPVYLWIQGDRAELRPTGDLWGLDTAVTQERIRAETDPKARIACIGPAGERLSLIAAIINDEGRAAARSGLGAVMGSKRLKAVAVRGTDKLTLHDPERVKQLRQDLVAVVKESRWLDRFMVSRSGLVGRVMRRVPVDLPTPQSLAREVYRTYGTCGTTDYSVEIGDSPVRNWTGVGYRDFPYGTHSHQLGSDKVIAYQRRRYHCANCPLGCGGIIDVPDGPYQGEGTKPEYETLSAFGSLCLNNDLPSIITLNELCNREGFDAISLGGVLAFAMECYEHGVLTAADVDGLDLTWGNTEAMIALAGRIARREGVGDVLADGVRRAAERIGGRAADYAVHAGGQELPMHDPKVDHGFGIAYQAEPTPGRHTIAADIYVDLRLLLAKYPDRLKKGATMSKRQALTSQYYHALSAAGLCIFGTDTCPIPLAEWINAVTGWSLTDEDLLDVGARIASLQQAFNIRAGIAPAEVYIHPRAVGDPPLDDGPTKGVTVDLEALVRVFYREMGWSEETGWPTRDRLEALGLGEVARELYG